VFCIAIVAEPDGRGSWQLRICGVRFTPESPTGCAAHRFAIGYNALFKLAWKGQPHEMPSLLPHQQLGWTKRDRGPGSDKRARALARSEGNDTNGKTVLTKDVMIIAKKAADELNQILFLKNTVAVPAVPTAPQVAQAPADVLSRGPLNVGGGIGRMGLFNTAPKARSMFGRPAKTDYSAPFDSSTPLSNDTTMMLSKLAGAAFDTHQPRRKAAQQKIKIELTKEQQEDPKPWKFYEARKKEVDEAAQRGREEAAREAAALSTSRVTRRKKQPLALTLSEFKASRASKRRL
jgi:hypothetical protein